MDPHYIKCFVQSVQNVFSTMLQLPVAVREPKVKTPGGPQNDVSGIIGLSGDVVGTVVLAFPNETAERVVALFCGQKLEVSIRKLEPATTTTPGATAGARA